MDMFSAWIHMMYDYVMLSLIAFFVLSIGFLVYRAAIYLARRILPILARPFLRPVVRDLVQASQIASLTAELSRRTLERDEALRQLAILGARAEAQTAAAKVAGTSKI